MDDHIEENTPVEYLTECLTTFVQEATGSVEKFLASDFAQDAEAITEELGESLGEAVKLLKTLKSFASIPSKLYLRKFEQFCRGVYRIPLDKRQSYIKKLGRERFNQESVFILNVINRIEEEDKLPFLVKLLEAQTDGAIDLGEYRRLTVLVDRTLYNDLVYLEHSITADPVWLRTDSDFGLAASGLLVTAGNEWVTDTEDEECLGDTGVRFNYTLAAKKLAWILYGVQCDSTPSNMGVEKLELSTDEDMKEVLSIFDQ